MAPCNSSAVAFSYIRFSHPAQAEGDSLRRQVERAEAYCHRRGWVLDRTLSLRDLGVSAFRGDNALVGNLGVFLSAVRRGTVAPGSVLVVESIDRISRQGIDEGYDLIKGILKAGVRIVTLSPEREFGPEAVKSLSRGALEIQLILERAAEESERKSDRVGEAWVKKRDGAARREVVMMPKNPPAWVECRGGRLELIPARAAAVKRVFELSAAGYGAVQIVRRLTADGVPAFGTSGRWTRSYVSLLLADRRTVGECQPQSYRSGKRLPVGEPIPGYYQAAVTGQQWDLARAGVEQRKTFTGRIGREFVNLFAGLVTSARDGSAYYADRHLGVPSLHNMSSTKGTGKLYSYPYWAIEGALLGVIREVDPAEVIGPDHTPDELRVREAELVRCEADVANLEVELERGDDIPSVVRVLRKKEQLRAGLAADVARLRQQAASPLASSWGVAQTLADVLATAPDPHDARVRLRSALRRIVEVIYLLVVPVGADRRAAVQVVFKGGFARLVVVHARRGHATRPASAAVGGIDTDTHPVLSRLDMGRADHARQVERVLRRENPLTSPRPIAR